MEKTFAGKSRKKKTAKLDAPTKVKSLLLAAQLTGIPYFKLRENQGHPEFPKPGKIRSEKYDLKAIRVWFDRYGESNTPTLKPSQAAAIAKSDAGTRKTLLEISILEREHWPRKEVNEHISRANGTVMKMLYKKFLEEHPPQAEGLTAAQIRKLNKQFLDDAFLKLPKALQNAAGIV